MTESRQPLLGVGIYTVPEAARIARVRPARIRRWLKGHDYLDFRDLIEVRFVDAFRSHGVSWKTLRLAAERASEILQDPHPFSTQRFKTDGRKIFAELISETGEELLLDLVKSQYGFRQIIGPYLYEGLEFDDSKGAVRWYPLPGSHKVIIDPAVSFGQPIVQPEAVPTAILAKAAQVERSIERVARWYEVDPQAVQDAVEYEELLAA